MKINSQNKNNKLRIQLKKIISIKVL